MSEFRLPKDNTSTFILKKDLAFRAEIEQNPSGEFDFTSIQTDIINYAYYVEGEVHIPKGINRIKIDLVASTGTAIKYAEVKEDTTYVFGKYPGDLSGHLFFILYVYSESGVLVQFDNVESPSKVTISYSKEINDTPIE